jgi:hypothetical protein
VVGYRAVGLVSARAKRGSGQPAGDRGV